MTTPPVALMTRSANETTTVVHVTGELDLATVPLIEPELHALAVRAGPDLVLDLSGLSFCDSSGVGLFRRLHQRCVRAGTRLRLRNVQPQPAKAIRVLQLDLVVRCHFA